MVQEGNYATGDANSLKEKRRKADSECEIDHRIDLQELWPDGLITTGVLCIPIIITRPCVRPNIRQSSTLHTP